MTNNKLSKLETENYKKEDYHEKKEVPIYCKLNLTLKEAALYSNIGINKLNSLTSDPDCPFVLFIGHKKLIKRKPFEDFINNAKIGNELLKDIWENVVDISVF